MHTLGQLLSLISHEVRAPLGVMRGYLRLLDQQAMELSDAHRHAIRAGLKAGERATELLNQVSTLARLHREEVSFSLAPTPLEPLLRAAVREVVLPEEPAVTADLGETADVQVMADADMLRPALAGLTAAVVRAQARDAHVSLLARDESRNGEAGVAVTITAAKTPGGEHVEQPLDLSRGGLGLELPIAAFLIHAHRGEVEERRDQNTLVAIVVWLPQAPGPRPLASA